MSELQGPLGTTLYMVWFWEQDKDGEWQHLYDAVFSFPPWAEGYIMVESEKHPDRKYEIWTTDLDEKIKVKT